MTLHESIDAFRNAMIEQGILPPDYIIPDKFERYHVEGDRKGTRNGFYHLHTDGIPAGMFGSWKIEDGKPYNWCAKKRSDMTSKERRAHVARIKRQKAEHEAIRQEIHEEALKEARKEFDAAHEHVSHPYLEKKKAASYGTRVDYYEGDPQKPTLLVPVTDIHGAIHTLQRIYWSPAEGKFVKRFLAGGAVKRHFCPIGNIDPAGIILLTEGYGSGSSLHEATSLPAVCALSSGNLEPVAKIIRKAYRERSMKHRVFPTLKL